MKYVPPGQPGSIVSVEPRYENFIGGKWLAPTHGKYRVDLAPATAGPITEVADSRRRMSARAGRCPRGEGRLGRGVSNRASGSAQRDRRRGREEQGHAGGR